MAQMKAHLTWKAQSMEHIMACLIWVGTADGTDKGGLDLYGALNGTDDGLLDSDMHYI
jgi:hypothetical protein